MRQLTQKFPKSVGGIHRSTVIPQRLCRVLSAAARTANCWRARSASALSKLRYARNHHRRISDVFPWSIDRCRNQGRWGSPLISGGGALCGQRLIQPYCIPRRIPLLRQNFRPPYRKYWPANSLRRSREHGRQTCSLPAFQPHPHKPQLPCHTPRSSAAARRSRPCEWLPVRRREPSAAHTQMSDRQTS